MQDPRLQDAIQRLEGGGKILVSRLRYIGDVVLSLPLVHSLRERFPRASLHYLAEPEPLAVLQHHPDLDRLWRVPRGVLPGLRVAHLLRRERFDAVIDLFANPRSALLLRATGAPVRIGEARRVRRHLYTHARLLVPGKSAIEHHLDAATYLGVDAPSPQRPHLYLTASEIDAAAAWWPERASEAPRLLVHLAATQPAKEWPLERVVPLLHNLRHRGWTVVLTTAPRNPRPSLDAAARLPGVTRLPVLPLRQLLACVTKADAVLTMDGALTHCSVALGTPTLALFGPTIPSIWFPYESFGAYRVLHGGVDCGDCDRHWCPTKACMTAISVERVEESLLEIVALSQRAEEGSHG